MTRCPNGHTVEVVFDLPDYGDAAALYQCARCWTLIVVDPGAEFYVGPPWDQKRTEAPCPSCAGSLVDARLYPDHFVCPLCGEVGSFEVPGRYPPDEERTTITGWDPYEGDKPTAL